MTSLLLTFRLLLRLSPPSVNTLYNQPTSLPGNRSYYTLLMLFCLSLWLFQLSIALPVDIVQTFLRRKLIYCVTARPS